MENMVDSKKVISLIEECIDTKVDLEQVLKTSDDLTKIGLNSLSFIKLVVAIEGAFNISFEDEQLDYTKFLSLTDLCTYINKRAQML